MRLEKKISSIVLCWLFILLLHGCMVVKKPSLKELNALDQPPPQVMAKLEIYLPKVSRWYAELEQELAQQGRRLTVEELKVAEKLGVLEPERVRVLVLEKFPMPQDSALLVEAKKYGLGSMTEGGRSIGHLVLLKPWVVAHKEVLNHELVHVAQMDRMGQEAFLRRYLIELEMMGYARSPLELEAYSKQGISTIP